MPAGGPWCNAWQRSNGCQKQLPALPQAVGHAQVGSDHRLCPEAVCVLQSIFTTRGRHGWALAGCTDVRKEQVRAWESG